MPVKNVIKRFKYGDSVYVVYERGGTGQIVVAEEINQHHIKPLVFGDIKEALTVLKFVIRALGGDPCGKVEERGGA